MVDRCTLPELDDVLLSLADQGYDSFVVELRTTSRTTAMAPPGHLVTTIDGAGATDDVWISSLADDAPDDLHAELGR